MANIFGRPAQSIWTDQSTGICYDAATMAPLPTAGDDLGEKPGRGAELTELTGNGINDFAALLGIDPENS